ncbi:MAG: oxidoreductase [Saprospiraceae bacterium]|nr:oxidoreductase [Saprospiraceae bacterium]
MPVKWYDGRVVEINQLTPFTKQFFVKLEGHDVFDFLPGQFVTMDLPVSEKRLFRWRSYSIANHPAGDNMLEFCIAHAEQGLGTKYLFEEVSKGTILRLKGPDGGFVLSDAQDREIIMICTGTGVAPFRSMIRHFIFNNLPFKRIHLIFGTRNIDGLLYYEEFRNIVDAKANFIYDVALSREEKHGFYHGYVHDIYRTLYQDFNPKRHFYICGWSNMIDEAVANLIVEMGYDISQVHYELYG